MTNGKRKGSSFEREVSKLLSLWWSDGADKNIFWRSVSSGAKATQMKKSGELLHSQSGDISLLKPISCKFIDDFYLELKFYQEFDLVSNVMAPTNKNKLYEFWDETIKQATLYGKTPLLIFKTNRNPISVCYNIYLPNIHDKLIICRNSTADFYVANLNVFLTNLKQDKYPS